MLPNPHLLIRPYLRREAVLSSLIEDTYAEVEELLLFDLGPESAPAKPSVREVANHIVALETGLNRLRAPLATAKFVPPPPHVLGQALDAWENYLHAETAEPPLVKIALLHYQFEAIHPFLDGNGRIGRLLITLYLCERKILSS